MIIIGDTVEPIDEYDDEEPVAQQPAYVEFDVRDWRCPSPYEAIAAYAKASQKGIYMVKEDFDRAFEVLCAVATARSGPEYQ